MGVPLNVIDYRCFWKAVSAMQKAEYQVNSIIIELDWAIGEQVSKQIDAMYSWYRYESRFALPVFNEVGEIERYNVFNVIMVIRHAKDGKMYLYDIMNIKKETSTLFQSEDITQ